MATSPSRIIAVPLLVSLGLTGLALTGGAALAETMSCIVSRGNLCFSTGCDNAGKSQRLALDLGAGTIRLCPNRFNDQGCTDGPMQFDIRDSAILGIAGAGQEIAARTVFVNRVTGAMTTTLIAAGGVASVDFGSCALPR